MTMRTGSIETSIGNQSMTIFTNTFQTLFVAICVLIACILLVRLLIFFMKRARYRKTDYYQQTHVPYLKLIRDTGRYGEYVTWRQLQRLPGYSRILCNIYVPTSQYGTTEIDMLLLHETGVYVIESKNYSGKIYGAADQPYWTQYAGSKRSTFYNPIWQNNNHIKHLQQFLSQHVYQQYPFFSFIVFSNRCDLGALQDVQRHHALMHRKYMVTNLRSTMRHNRAVLSPAQIDQLYTRLYPLTQASRQEQKAHVQNIQERNNRHGRKYRKSRV